LARRIVTRPLRIIHESLRTEVAPDIDMPYVAPELLHLGKAVTALLHLKQEINRSEQRYRGLFDNITLRARVNTHLELCRIRHELQQKNDILKAERVVIEGMIIRMRADPDFNGRHLRWLMRLIERTSGDIGLAAFCPDGRQMILVGDFTGHGLTAAIAGPGVKQSFYALCANGASMAQVLATLNDMLCAQLLVSQFMAAHLVEIDPVRRQARLWGGGMPEPLHVQANRAIRQIPLRGLPLGVMPGRDISEEVHTLSLQSGERLLLYTDGMIEALNAAGKMYRIERLEARYAALLQEGGTLDELIADLDAFAGGREQADDILLLELNVRARRGMRAPLKIQTSSRYCVATKILTLTYQTYAAR